MNRNVDKHTRTYSIIYSSYMPDVVPLCMSMFEWLMCLYLTRMVFWYIAAEVRAAHVVHSTDTHRTRAYVIRTHECGMFPTHTRTKAPTNHPPMHPGADTRMDKPMCASPSHTHPGRVFSFDYHLTVSLDVLHAHSMQSTVHRRSICEHLTRYDDTNASSVRCVCVCVYVCACNCD